MKIKGAIFDMDGTLVDSLMFWDILWEDLGVRYLGKTHFKPAEEIDRAVRTMIFSDAMAYVGRYYGISEEPKALMDFASRRLVDFYLRDVSLKKGAVALLEHLKALGVKMCLASAGDMKYIRLALGRFGLEHYFEAVLSCADLGVGKDRPDIYLNAIEALGLPAEEICVFEDSYVALETAKGLGLQTVGVYDRYNFGQDRLRGASSIYLDEHEALDGLIGQISV